MLRKPRRTDEPIPFLDLLFSNSLETQERIRRQYVIYASHLENLLSPREEQRHEKTNGARIQVYPFETDGYSEDTSVTRHAEFRRWNTLKFELPDGSPGGPLRIDPADCPCVIELGQISVARQDSGEILWSGEDTALRQLAYSGSIVLLPHEDKCLLFSHGDDPKLQLPASTETGEAISVSISLRIDRGLDAVSEVIEKSNKSTIETRDGEISRLASALQTERAARMAMERSLSWRSTRPIRAFMKLFTK